MLSDVVDHVICRSQAALLLWLLLLLLQRVAVKGTSVLINYLLFGYKFLWVFCPGFEQIAEKTV